MPADFLVRKFLRNVNHCYCNFLSLSSPPSKCSQFAFIVLPIRASVLTKFLLIKKLIISLVVVTVLQ